MDRGPWYGIIHRVVFLVELAPKHDPFSVEKAAHVSASAAAGISQNHQAGRRALCLSYLTSFCLIMITAASASPSLEKESPTI